jgi:hypothetical protein
MHVDFKKTRRTIGALAVTATLVLAANHVHADAGKNGIDLYAGGEMTAEDVFPALDGKHLHRNVVVLYRDDLKSAWSYYLNGAFKPHCTANAQMDAQRKHYQCEMPAYKDMVSVSLRLDETQDGHLEFTADYLYPK